MTYSCQETSFDFGTDSTEPFKPVKNFTISYAPTPGVSFIHDYTIPDTPDPFTQNDSKSGQKLLKHILRGFITLKKQNISEAKHWVCHEGGNLLER